jgi:hypothetical protein
MVFLNVIVGGLGSLRGAFTLILLCGCRISAAIVVEAPLCKYNSKTIALAKMQISSDGGLSKGELNLDVVHTTPWADYTTVVAQYQVCKVWPTHI